ncbi:magnesium transporter [Salaquimonas pukyongi]|uniref:magnesium transporter n=1 Tax=Salaquimonas pukyongi TaxID=2712698 RepID=UPI00096B6EA0|nr:magnesium transporter [Salaquimonas pukyongi]
MSLEDTDTGTPREGHEAVPGFDETLYNEDGHLRTDFTEAVREAVAAGNREAVVGLIGPLHESELGDLLEALASEDRQGLVRLAGGEFDFTSLTEVDEAIRLDVVGSLPNAAIADAIQDLDSDDAIYILEDMEKADQEEVLDRLPFDDRILLRRALEYPEESAGRRMQTEFIAVPPFWTVGQAIDYMREEEELPNRFHEIFIISPQYELLGYVQLDRLLRTGRSARIETIMEESIHPIDAMLDQEEAAYIFQQYDLLSAAVVDNGGRLVGVMTIDDIVDVINQEAEEDIKRLAGVGDEELSDTVLEIARSRFLWLLINLVTAVLASAVIGLFDGTIEQMVALAILMPIVASMGGNAGTQTMTVAVRALATRDMDSYNTRRIIRREILVGLLNGAAFALLIGVIAAWWFSSPDIGLIIAVAMVFNMLCAALAGILIPILLDRLDLDPAIASSVFVTTVTDVVGFFAFLGLAAWWFGI